MSREEQRRERKKERQKRRKKKKTRPDTRQFRRGRFGRSSNVKTARNSKMLRTDGPTDTARCRVACPRLKTSRRSRLIKLLSSGSARRLTLQREKVAHFLWEEAKTMSFTPQDRPKFCQDTVRWEQRRPRLEDRFKVS